MEWVNDWYSAGYYSVSPTNDPPGPASGTNRVLRGGAWNYDTNYLRSSYRTYNVPTAYWNDDDGFRCVR